MRRIKAFWYSLKYELDRKVGGLALRQARLSLSLALAVGAVMVLVQIGFDFQRERERLQQEISSIIGASKPIAVDALWNLNKQTATGLADGLIAHPLVYRMELKTYTDTVLTERVRPKTELPSWSSLFRLIESPVLTYSLSRGGSEEELLGQMTIWMDEGHAAKGFVSRLWVIVVSGMVRAMILAIALMVLFHLTLTRPIAMYSEWLRHIDPKSPEGWSKPLPMRQRHDDLSKAAMTAYRRFAEAREHFLELNAVRDELKQVNSELEDRVEERTQELEATLAKFEALALTDDLTGLPNRRSFMDHFQRAFAHWQRQKIPFALVLIDLDYFKQVNDRYGHQVGDFALQHAAKVFVSALRQQDIVGRIGGEEFAALLMGVTPSESITLSQRLCERLAANPLIYGDKSELSLTASFGLVVSDQMTGDYRHAYRDADTLLYRAKQEGRNRVIYAEMA